MKKKLFISLFLCVLCFFVVSFKAYASSEVYVTAGNADYSSIELSKSVLNKAKSNCTKKGSNFKSTQTISESYQVHIYHFEAPSSGYYAFYTTGSKDTLIKVYEHQNFMWWTTSYKDLGKVDDTSKADTNYFNAGFVLDASSGEDYYICVRLYGSSKGSYTLNVEPNEDKLLRSRYDKSFWECDYLSTASAIAGCWVTSKQYLTAEETILFYWSLDPACQNMVGKDLEYLYNEYNKGIQYGIDAANFILGILLAGADPVTSLSVSVIGSIISYAYSASENDAYSMMVTLNELCGVECYGSGWTADHGLVIEDFYTGTILGNNYYFYAYDDDLLVGDKYAKGSWTN